MRVLLISQCSKKALNETRRIIDQFAERKGDCVWETNITEQGLDTVKKLLKSTARRNTAVACHLFRGRLETELLWIVGNRRKFSRDGIVPTNITTKDVLGADDENDWKTGEAIAILARIAGLFHDFGKANDLFQKKLRKEGKKNYEPFRHEWISLLLFKQFVGSSSDKEWIEKLSTISSADEVQFLKNFPNEKNHRLKNPLKDLPNLAKFIAWLILSHHKLPEYIKNNISDEPILANIDNWIDGERFSSLWNSLNCEFKWTKQELKMVEKFSEGTPVKSYSWCKYAQKTALRALKYYDILDRDWFCDRFSMHLSRAALMLADHIYSRGLKLFA